MIKRIMFVCHGNICRSPMAEFIMKDIVKRADMSDEFIISSAATSTEEIGNNIYPPAQAELKRRGIPFKNRRAVQLRPNDYDKYDLFIIMDSFNQKNIRYIFDSDEQNKIHKLLEYTGTDKDVSDPWYSGKFDTAFDDIYSGCRALFEALK